jgi:ribosomal protein L37AE/L43A
MPAASGAKRQAHPTSVTVKEETLEAILKDFQCEACGHYEVRRTERESWYTCVNCGYCFGIEPYPRKQLRRAMEAGGSGSISH